MSQRTEQVDELLRHEIADVVTREVADPRVGFATITEVETTPDLRHATVWVSVIGQPGERSETIEALARAMPFVRRSIGRRLRMKRIPELHVRLDDTAERGTRVLRLLDELRAGGEVHPDAPLGESLPTPVPRLHHEGDAPDEPAPAAEEASIARTPRRRRARGGPAVRRRPR